MVVAYFLEHTRTHLTLMGCRLEASEPCMSDIVIGRAQYVSVVQAVVDEI